MLWRHRGLKRLRTAFTNHFFTARFIMIRQPLEYAKRTTVNAYINALENLYGVQLQQHADRLIKTVSQPKHAHFGDLSIPCAIMGKELGQNPADLAIAAKEWLDQNGDGDYARIFSDTHVEKIFLSFTYSLDWLGEIVLQINERGFLQPDDEKREKVMIEYSQPNTHKVFHVGHMRNVALGNSLVNLYRHFGHETIAANYFGDEGAHVAKCLWQLQNVLEGDIEDLKLDESLSRGEWLGKQYVRASELVDLTAMTQYPFPGVISARVLSKESHPAEDAPNNWHVVQLLIDEQKDEQVTVVCGGNAYEVNDVVAYLPVGQYLKKKLVVEKDMNGVISCGVMLSFKELGLDPPLLAEDSAVKHDEDNGKKKKKKKKKKQTRNNKAIFVLPRESTVGLPLVEIGRTADCDISEDQSILEVLETRKYQISDTLVKMESRDAETIRLWDITKQWSLDDFHEIYKWLDAPFDHEFFESEVADESKELVTEYFEKKVLIESEGAIGANLEDYGLGFCILLKSDGTGLYATKDLALAHRKFTVFDVERSIYVVDASQSLHFKQVFKTLELMGYENASKCFHLPYGQVRVPSGKMSSRKGNDIYFSALKKTLGDQIYNDYLSTKEGWSPEEIQNVQHALSVGTIKYGMLNVDPSKDIVFEMSKWSARTGNTGVYLMYGYSRTQSLLDKVPFPKDQVYDSSYFGKNEMERLILIKLSEVWTTLEQATYTYKPSLLCAYLYELTKMLMVLYESERLLDIEDLGRRFTLLCLYKAIGEVLMVGLNLLGIRTINRM